MNWEAGPRSKRANKAAPATRNLRSLYRCLERRRPTVEKRERADDEYVSNMVFTSVARNSGESCALHESKPEKQGNWCLYSEIGAETATRCRRLLAQASSQIHRQINECSLSRS